MNIDSLICAFEYMMTTKRELDECNKGCAYSPAYYCAHQAECYEEASKRFADKLDNVITARACDLLVELGLVAADHPRVAQIKEALNKPDWESGP